MVSINDGGTPDTADDYATLTNTPITDAWYVLPSEYTWEYSLYDEPPPDYGDPLIDGFGFVFQGTLNDWGGPDGAQIVPLGVDDGFLYPSNPVGYAAPIDSATGDFDISYYDGIDMAESGALVALGDFFDMVCASGESWIDPPEEAYVSSQVSFQILDADGNEIGSAYIAPSDFDGFAFWYSDREEAVVGSCLDSENEPIDFDMQMQAGWNTAEITVTPASDNGTPDDPSDDSYKYVITVTPITGDTYALPSGYTMEYHLNSSVSSLGMLGLPTLMKPSAPLSRIF